MKLMVIDGNSIINRAFYGVRPLTTREGIPTNAVYGFITMLLRFLDEEQPEALCVTFDRREPTFRHLAYEGYKAQRKGMPEELAQQLPILKEVLDAMAIPRYELAGYEADDLIGTIARRCEEEGGTCCIVTGDKDSLQLITDNTKVKLVSTVKGKTVTKEMTRAAFEESYGFPPIHMIDLKALMGDPSDNISGITGVGEKTALPLIQTYHTIDALYAAMPEVNVRPAMLKKLKEGEDAARVSYCLATIMTDAPLTFSLTDMRRRPYQPELHDLFLRLEFTSLIERLNIDTPAMPCEKMVCTREMVTAPQRAEELLTLWRGQEYVSCLVRPALDGVCVAWNEGETAHTAMVLPQNYPEYNHFLSQLFDGRISIVTHEAKELMRALREEQFPAEGIRFDTALAGYLLDATAGHYEVEHLAVSWLNMAVPKTEVYCEENAFSMLDNLSEILAAWEQHTLLLEILYQKMLPCLREQQVDTLYFSVELPLCRVLAEMELTGFCVDAGMMRDFGGVLSKALNTLEKKIYSYVGEFNINSPMQLGEVLFEKLELPPHKKTKRGYSTNAEVLEKLRGLHPIVNEVLEYRQYAKLKSTYVDGLLKVIAPDGRVRTRFQMTATATGRLSSIEPNLQNIPTRTELGSELRRMFSADEGNVLVDADYSQIELRLLAHISGDEAMREAFLSGEDFHTVTASHVFAVPVQEVTPAMRRAAKAVNFGIVYGISAFSLSQDLGITIGEAKEYMETYFARFPAVKQYMESVVAQAQKNGYVETLMHRRRVLPEIKATQYNTRAFGERVALNTPVQGTAADIIKLAMVRVSERLKQEGLAARLIMQVHDELIVECPEQEAERVKQLLTEEMEGVYTLSVPLIVQVHSGKTWWDAKE